MKDYTGATLEEVLAAAAEELGVGTEELKYSNMHEEKDEEGNTTVSAFVYTNDDVKEFLFDYLGEFFTSIDQDLEVSIEERNDSFIVNLNADNNAVLIGKAGKTLAAFNTVVHSAVNAAFHQRIDVLIDVNHYKEDRYSKLRHTVKRIARQVQESHVDAELDPMPSDERKVIHQYLNEWHNIRTDSKGEGQNRHICISYVPDEGEEETEEIEDMSL